MPARFFLLAFVWAAAPRASAQMDHMSMMNGNYGPYPLSREASGTSWQPESTPHEGMHTMRGPWMLMLHGFADGIYDNQGGPRGAEKAYSAGMLMFMAQRPLGDGTLGLRGMMSLDPSMGAAGYPLLLQTGETANGTTPLIDRQHPHDLFMELALAYGYALNDRSSIFAYFGLPGEPALGPPAFMHRLSGLDNPEAPLTHHWLDSTHVAFGVATAGYVWESWKLEGSAFRGREPDQRRWDIEPPKFDSFSTRLSFNPTRDWALQASYGHLASPEQLEPGVNTERFTASASCNRTGSLGAWQTTFAFGRNMNAPGNDLNAFLLESALRLGGAHTIFARAERVDKDELLAGKIFTVNRLSLGYIFDFARWKRSQWGVGGVGAVHILPAALNAAYGRVPASLMLLARVKLI